LPVVVGVSGGADSVALVHALHALHRSPPRGAGSLIVAHYNHGLRGESSDADAAFVRQLAEQLDLPFVGGGADGSLPAELSPRDENRLRQRRLDFLLATAHRWGARYVALAHTANDQSETVLHRILRGTGLTGLAGIPRVRRLSTATTLIRPLLSRSRSQILRYLKSLGQPFRHDHSNDDWRYTRNRLRHELLPHLASAYNPRIVAVLGRLAAQARAVEELIEPLVEALRERVERPVSPTETVLDAVPLRDQPDYLLAELFVGIWKRYGWPAQAMTATHWRRLVRFALQTGRRAEPCEPLGSVAAGKSRPSSTSGGILTLPHRIRVESLATGQLRLTWQV
jgi:tRNA(Ile)-lysidine synthase